MTEIPEHLLKRSQERRAALGLGGDGGGGDAGADAAAASPADSAPSTAVAAAAAPPAAATPTEIEPAKPEPVPPYVEAALRRKRVPIWALPVLAALPIWALVYAATLEPPSLGDSDPLAFGATVYASNCAACHGATGGGGVGPQLSGGSVLESFADPLDQIDWVTKGSQGFLDAGETTYGDTAKPIAGGMPAWGGVLAPEEIAAVVYYERTGLSGEDPANPALLDPTGQLLVDGVPVVVGGGGATHH